MKNSQTFTQRFQRTSAMEANFFSAMFDVLNACSRRGDEADASPGSRKIRLVTYATSRNLVKPGKVRFTTRKISVINLIPHQVRISRRAKYVSLRMSLRRGLEIVVPPSYDLRKIPEVLESKRKWIEAITHRFNQLPKPAPIEVRPAEIHLTALGASWRVEYVQTNRRSVKIEESGNQLCVSGKIESDLACRRVLRKWLLRKGQTMLIPWLQQISAEMGLPFSKAAVRLQRSRWGSCSRRKTISLNAKLLFLAPELVRYLFIHELCHTAQMNHSERFWSLVESKEPNYRVLDKQMSKAMRIVPAWV